MAICPECRKQFPDDVKDCPEHGLALLPASIFTNEDKDLEVGSLVGDYRIEAKLGEGSFGRVYRAEHPIIGRRVAVKVLHRALSTDPHAVSRFVAEARAIVEAESPHIVDIFGFGALPDGRQYYLMELLDGMSLERYLRAHRPIDLPVALRILAGVADALAAAHAVDVVHRDLKPDNVFIVFDRNGDPAAKLLDFGVAKLLGDHKLSHHTSTGAMIGTPAYMAPEQALGLEIDRRADIYAFGLVAFEMLAGKLPFEASSLVELVRKHASEPPPLLSSVRPELGEALDPVIARMLEKDPAERFATIGEAFAGLCGAARRAGHDVSLPAYLSLRPPPAAASAPTPPAEVAWDASTLASGETVEAPPHASATNSVNGAAGQARRRAGIARLLSTGRRRWLAGGAAVLVVPAGLLAAWTLMPAHRSAQLTPSAPAESASQPSPPSLASVDAGATPHRADTVELRVETTVPEAHVFLGPDDLGAVPGPFALPRGETPLQLEVRAVGYRTAVLPFVPNKNDTRTPSLTRLAGPSATRPAGSEGTAKPAASTSSGVSPEIAVPSYP